MKILKRILISLVLLAAIGFFVAHLLDFKSPSEKILAQNRCYALPCDTIDVLLWNIGYAGLDAEMDFFYEGGKRSRQSKAQTKNNLQAICDFLKLNDSVDFMLLQEVDMNSRRTYRIDEFAEISNRLPHFHSYFDVNYDVQFIPLPITNPTGRVCSGLTFHSAHTVCELVHYAYANQQDFFMRPFLYDRCFTAARFDLKNGHQLVLINNHNSAFDDGNQRNAEMNFLKQFILDEYARGNYVIVGGDWNQTPPTYDKNSASVRHFTPLKIDSNFMPSDWNWFVGDIATNRYLDKPYTKNESQTTTLDFFLASPNINCIDIKVVDLQFANSDHNPVIARFGFN